MNPAQTIHLHPTYSDIAQLREELDTCLADGDQCESFFLTCSQTDGIHPNDLSLAQLKYTPCFSSMFHYDEKRLYQKQIFQNICELATSPEHIEEKEKISLELSELKNKMELCKKISKSFRKKIIILIQTKPEILLTEELDKCSKMQPFPVSLGRIFFLPEMESLEGPIGECHCGLTMDRRSRNDFSHLVINAITKHFPERKSLTACAIGAGMCFQELEIHTLALEKGYTITQWSLVDTSLLKKTAENFETLVKWATPTTFITTLEKSAGHYFRNLQKNPHLSSPDLFLFIDVPIQEAKVRDYVENLNNPCLYAYFSKKLSRATYHESKKNIPNRKELII